MAIGHSQYSNTPITKPSGIYFEHINNVKFFESHWNLVSYIPLNPFSKKLEFIESIFKRTIVICEIGKHRLDLKLCSSSFTLLNQMLISLTNNQKTLKDLIGQENRRQKRALLNIIGSVMKTLFGTLDYNDAEYYNQAIKNAESNENNLLKLLQEQVHVVKTTITNFNNTIIKLDENKGIFNKNLEIISNYTLETNKKYFSLELKQKIEEHFALLSFYITELQNEYSTLTNAILFAKSNNLHPFIITPQQLIEELSKTITHVPSNANYPLPLNSENSHKYLEIASIKYRYFEDKIIFVISIPLINNMQYFLYKPIPLPINHPNFNQLTFILPSMNYLAMSENRNIYATLDIINKCFLLTQESLICDSPDSFHFTHVEPICETDLLTSSSDLLTNCETRITNTKYEIWHKLTKPNSWIYVLPKRTDITISCIDASTVTINLMHTGVLTTKNNCKIYTGSTILIANIIPKESSFQSIIPDITIFDECCDKTDYKYNDSKLNFIPFQLNNLDSEALKISSHKLDRIEENMNQYTFDKFTNQFHHNSYFVYFICTILKFIALYILYKLFKYLKIKTLRTKGKSGSNCQKIMNCLTLNLCQARKKDKTHVNIDLSDLDNKIVSKVRENTPIRRSERIAQLKDSL